MAQTIRTTEPARRTRGEVAPAPLIAAARDLVKSCGGNDLKAAVGIGIARSTLARVLAGLPVLRGNIAILRAKFPEVSA